MKHPTHEALRRLRLYGMARGLEDLERQPERSQLSFDDQLALLVERETAERANTALASRLKRARLRQTACLEDLDWRTPRGLDRTLVRDLASCRWVREHQPLLVTGPTGIGKTFVACALGNAYFHRFRPVVFIETGHQCSRKPDSRFHDFGQPFSLRTAHVEGELSV